MENCPVLYIFNDLNDIHFYDKHKLVIHEPELNIDLNVQTLDSDYNSVFAECANCLFRFVLPPDKNIDDLPDKNIDYLPELNNITYCNYCIYLHYSPNCTPTVSHTNIKIINNNSNNIKINKNSNNNKLDNDIQEFKILLFLFVLLFLSIMFR